MATIELDNGLKFEVDAGFTRLSPEEQQAAVDEMVASVNQTQQQPKTTSNLFEGIDQRSGRIAENLERGIEKMGIPLISKGAGWLADKTQADLDSRDPYAPSTSLQDVKDAAGLRKVPAGLSFGLQTGLSSVPDMVMATNPLSIAPYLGSRTEEIATERAINDGRSREETTGGDYAVAAPTALAITAAERLAGKITLGSPQGGLVTKALKRGAGETLTEIPQENLELAATRIGTERGGPSLGEYGDATLAAGLAGVTTGPTVGAVGDAVRAAPDAIEGYQNNRAQRHFDAKDVDLEQIAAEERVYRRMEQKINDRIFKGNAAEKEVRNRSIKSVWDEIKGELFLAADEMKKAGIITQSEYNSVFKREGSVFSQSKNSQRHVTFEDLSAIDTLQIEPAAKETLRKLAYDLEIASTDGFKSRGQGMFETLGKSRPGEGIGGAFGAAIGGTSGVFGGPVTGVPGAVIGAGIGAAYAPKVGRAVDNVFPSSKKPRIIREAKKRGRVLDSLGTDVGDTKQLATDLTANARAGLDIANKERQADIQQRRGLRAARRLDNDPGFSGFDSSIFDKVGLTPIEVDNGMLQLLKKGIITPEQHKAFLTEPEVLMEDKQGLLIMDHLNNLANKGKIQRDPEFKRPGTPVGPGVFNQTAYDASTDHAVQMANTARQAAPDASARAVVDRVAAAKSYADKVNALEEGIAKLPQYNDFFKEFVEPLLDNTKRTAAQAVGAPLRAPMGFRGPEGTTNQAPGSGASVLAGDVFDGPLQQKPGFDLTPDPKKEAQANDRRENFERNRREHPEWFQGAIDEEGNLEIVHYSTEEISRTDTGKFLSGLAGQSREERNNAYGAPKKTYFGLEAATENPYRKEGGLGGVRHTGKIKAEDYYPIHQDHLGIFDGGTDLAAKERKIQDSGYKGYWRDHPRLGKVIVSFDNVDVTPDGPKVHEGGALSKANEAHEKSMLDPLRHVSQLPGTTKNGDHSHRISTRVPTTKVNPEDPIANNLINDRDSVVSQPKHLKSVATSIRDYTEFKGKFDSLTDEQVVDEYVEHLAGNIVWVYDQIPEDIRQRSKKWYKGANKVVGEWTDRFNADITRAGSNMPELTPAKIAAVIAAQSPQKDWYQNASLAERMIDIYVNKRNDPWTDEMTAAADKIFPADKYPNLSATLTGRTLADVLMDGGEGYQNSRGKDKPLRQQALIGAYIRIHDTAHGDRSHRILTPEGDFGDIVRKKDGTPSGTGWGSLVEIGKGVAVLEDGSIENISKEMGGKHKIRNFYNNILAPDNPHGDLTADTHAVAVGHLKPLSGKSLEVDHNFGSTSVKGRKGAGGSANTGASGTYGLHAEAYRIAAERIGSGILPREMQSITWEAIRGLFSDTFKGNKKNVAAVEQVWTDYAKGDISLNAARRKIIKIAGGFDAPDWHE